MSHACDEAQTHVLYHRLNLRANEAHSLMCSKLKGLCTGVYIGNILAKKKKNAFDVDTVLLRLDAAEMQFFCHMYSQIMGCPDMLKFREGLVRNVVC